MKRKKRLILMELLIIIGIIIVLAVGILSPIYDRVWGVNPSPAKPFIPLLNWEERSDWLNVKTDINPPAEGDGISDDTEALQSALNAMESGSTLFLPPGTYRITKTLVLQGEDRRSHYRRSDNWLWKINEDHLGRPR